MEVYLPIHRAMILQDPRANIQFHHGIPDPGFFIEGYERGRRVGHVTQRFLKPSFVNRWLHFFVSL